MSPLGFSPSKTELILTLIPASPLEKFIFGDGIGTGSSQWSRQGEAESNPSLVGGGPGPGPATGLNYL